MIPEIRNHSYHQRIQDLCLISLGQRRLQGQLIELFKYLYGFTTAVQEGFLITTLMTEQLTMEQNLLKNISIISGPTPLPN